MKRGMNLIVFICIFGIILSLNLVASDFTKADEVYNITYIYGPSQQIKGWINISLEDEPANSLLTGFDSNITLKEFLDANYASYSCFPSDCKPSYSAPASGDTSKTIELGFSDESVLGIKMIGDISDIISFSFDITTDAKASCLHPLQIDISDNENIEWKAEKVSYDSNCATPDEYGCFDEAESGDSVEILTTTTYCEEINLYSPSKGFEIGADVIGSGNADFTMTLDGEKECTASANGNSEISCFVEFDSPLEYPITAEVCIKGKNLNGNTYEIKYEDAEPICGSSGGYAHDYEIFAKARKFTEVEDFTLNQDLMDSLDNGIDLTGEVWDYVNKYGSDCNPECIIPIKFYSGTSQAITISNLNLNYTETGHPRSTSEIYNLVEAQALITADFQKLDLEKGDFLVPSDLGADEFSLKLGGSEIFKQDINVRPVPGISDIIPHTLPALVNVNFIALLDDSGVNLTYNWYFGDGSDNESTLENTIMHMYPNIGAYDITLKVSNEYGESSKTVTLDVISPEAAINSTITDYENDLTNVETQINALPKWISKEIEKKVDLDALKVNLDAQKNKYDDCKDLELCSSADYVDIMSKLLELNIPYKLNTSQTINPLAFFSHEEQLDLEILENIGAGTADESASEYHKAINAWIMENLDITLESKTYAFYYDSGVEPLVSYVKVILKPKQDLDEFYVIVNGDPSFIEFNNIESKDIGAIAAGIIFSELTQSKTIEFLYPGAISMDSLPLYISPEFKNLDTGIDVGICNSNGECEKERGETYKNCRNDCKPLGWTFFWFFILIIIAFAVYIALQEWYKKHYESKLFPNKSQFYNLINFINNSLNQGLKKSDIFSKLGGLGWGKEQLKYSWKKLHGKRTGMWEIPVLKWVEKKKVKQELEKRGNTPDLKDLSLKP